MDSNNKLTLYISYYLARFNNEALQHLGYSTWNEAFGDVSRKLKVKAHSVKNWRDEFDPLFGHRAGWYQRPMTRSRVKVAQALEFLTEIQIRELVKDILSGKLKQDPDAEDQLLSIITDDSDRILRQYIVRTPTGRAAEEFFMQHHLVNSRPKPGNLVDCRDRGCGYDFTIQSHDGDFFIEVKGLTEFSGGVLFTDKEWRTAMEKADRFILCIVRNIQDNPTICFINNPYQRLSAKKSFYTTIQINWSISQNEIQRIS